MENLNINENATNRNFVYPFELCLDELLEFCLVGTILTDKPIRFSVMKERLSKLWKPEQGVAISAMEENKFLFQFFHLWDMKRVFQGGPWLYDNHMLVLKKLDVGDDPLNTELDEVEMWVQVFNLPFGYMTESIGLLIGSHIGRFVKYDDLNNYGSWRLYMRIRVAVKVNETLKKSFTFEKEDGGIVHLHFKYEKLGAFCFECGLLGHTKNFCPKRFELDFVDGEKGWGNFIRSGNSAIGGGATVNKWLCSGKGQNRGGRGGGRSSSGVADDSNATMTEVVGVNVGQPVPHALFGRVKVLRDVRGRGFIFHTTIASSKSKVASYAAEVQWIPFEINFNTLRRLFIDSAMGQKQLSEHNINSLIMTTGTSRSLQPEEAIVGIDSAVVVGASSDVTGSNLLIKDAESDATLMSEGVTTQILTQISAGSGDKFVTGPKKRIRYAQDVQDEENAEEQGMEIETCYEE
ncbi:hypothetical protein TSUD_08930 [Trifolium subterraneum]|nr:hypothetical protein TSUD_08930 [Trifolium subterraneum]